jgi:hypothetical protein
MTDYATIIPTAAALLALLVAVAALMRGWQGWLDLKRAEMESRDAPAGGAPSPAARIQLADLKERVRRLEAIANGVEG